jgi:hypothetical protein
LSLSTATFAEGQSIDRAGHVGLDWADFLESHAARAYASVTMADVLAAKAILARVRKGDLPRTFAGRDIQRKVLGAAVGPADYRRCTEFVG